MDRTQLLQEIRKMAFERIYNGWTEGKLLSVLGSGDCSKLLFFYDIL